MEFSLPPIIVLGMISSIVLPALVGLVTTRVTSSNTKALLLAGLSAVAGLVGEVVNSMNAGTTYDLGTGLLAALGVFATASAVHFGLFKPTGISESLQAVGSKGTGTV